MIVRLNDKFFIRSSSGVAKDRVDLVEKIMQYHKIVNDQKIKLDQPVPSKKVWGLDMTPLKAAETAAKLNINLKDQKYILKQFITEYNATLESFMNQVKQV